MAPGAPARILLAFVYAATRTILVPLASCLYDFLPFTLVHTFSYPRRPPPASRAFTLQLSRLTCRTLLVSQRMTLTTNRALKYLKKIAHVSKLDT